MRAHIAKWNLDIHYFMVSNAFYGNNFYCKNIQKQNEIETNDSQVFILGRRKAM